jgi:hypothetical protein
VEGLTVGRMVHFVDQYDARHYAAIVTKVSAVPGVVNLVVFGDDDTWYGVLVPYDPAGVQPFSWHWIERA